MLSEIAGVRQDGPDQKRLWFQDEFFDLFVWADPTGKVLAFQLCYDRLRRERVLAWNEKSGFIHRRVDDGEQTPLKNRAPILVADGAFPAAKVAAEFERRNTALENSLQDFIRVKIREAGSHLSRQKRSAKD